MAVPGDIEARKFYWLAQQRLEDGRLIMEKLNRPRAAVYLTGYASECILKALLIMSTPSAKRRGVVESFRGARGHDIAWLKVRLMLVGVSFPPAVARELAFLSGWSTELRYEPGMGSRREAERFIASTDILLNWAEGRM